jgi:hypothetical protein
VLQWTSTYLKDFVRNFLPKLNPKIDSLQVMVIRTPKGMYLRMGDKIIKIRLSPAMMASLKSVSKVGASSEPQDPPQVVTIDSSSDSEGRSNGDGAPPRLDEPIRFPVPAEAADYFAVSQDGHGYQHDIGEDSVPVPLQDLQVSGDHFSAPDFPAFQSVHIPENGAE